MPEKKFVPPAYGKFGKKLKDLLKKKYDFENKVTTKHNTRTAGLTIEASGVAGCTSLNGAFKGKYKDKKFGEAEAEVNTCGKLVGTAKFDKIAKGLEVNLSGGVDPSAKKKGCNDKLSAEYAQEFFATSGFVDVNFGDATTAVVEATAVVGFEGLSVGGQLAFDVSQSAQKVSDINVGAEYTRDDSTFTLLTEKKGDVIRGSLHHLIRPNYQVGFQFDYSPRAEDVKKQRVFTAGTEYQLDVDTTVKAKVDTTGVIQTAISHNLQNPSLQLAMAASFTRKSADCLSADKFGLSLTFGDY
jgi:hypothetical protein